MSRCRLITRPELPVDSAELARYLIGKILVHDSAEGCMSGRIVETEAYLEGDAAAHSFRGMTARNKSLFLERGHAYVYFIYGSWYSMNVSGGAFGVGAGVLLRALEPIEGIDLMRMRRPLAKLHRLTSGPGCLATAMDIDKRYDGVDLCRPGSLWLGVLSDCQNRIRLGNSPRIGLTKEAHRLLRYFEKDNPCVSGPKRLRI